MGGWQLTESRQGAGKLGRTSADLAAVPGLPSIISVSGNIYLWPRRQLIRGRGSRGPNLSPGEDSLQMQAVTALGNELPGP